MRFSPIDLFIRMKDSEKRLQSSVLPRFLTIHGERPLVDVTKIYTIERFFPGWFEKSDSGILIEFLLNPEECKVRVIFVIFMPIRILLFYRKCGDARVL